MGKKETINKNTVPTGFTKAMARVDLIPVIFFGITFYLLGMLVNSPLLSIGAVISTVSGLIKVIWKYIVVIKKKNVWPLFLQMRIAMPIGMLLIIAGIVICIINKNAGMLIGLLQMPSLIFTIIGLLGMALMIFFAVKLDSSDAKSNWIEQITNGTAQLSFFIAVLILVVGIKNVPQKPITPADNTNATVSPAVETTEHKGFSVSGTELLDANGNPFIMRGVNMAHKWFAIQDQVSLQGIADTGANCVRVVCANGKQWNKDSDKSLAAIIEYCKKLKLVVILEVHDGTGKNDLDILSSIVDYWIEMKEVFDGTEAYCIINIANEWLGNWDTKTWEKGYVDAIKRMREAGIKNTLMVDTGGYGQNAKCIEKSGKTVFEADVLKNTMFSIHMYGTAGRNAKTIQTNLEYATKQNLCVCVGEFGYTHTDGDVDEAFLMDYCTKNSIGYLAWSWKGNSGGVEYLDLVSTWDGSKLTTNWGEVVVNGVNGIKQTSKICTVYNP